MKETHKKELKNFYRDHVAPYIEGPARFPDVTGESFGINNPIADYDVLGVAVLTNLGHKVEIICPNRESYDIHVSRIVICGGLAGNLTWVNDPEKEEKKESKSRLQRWVDAQQKKKK